MSLHWDVSAFLATLPIMAKGMLGIFAVTLVIWGFIALLRRAGKKREKD